MQIVSVVESEWIAVVGPSEAIRQSAAQTRGGQAVVLRAPNGSYAGALMVLVDGRVDDPVAQIASAVASTRAPVYLVCDQCSLEDYDAALAAGARAVIPRGTEVDVIPPPRGDASLTAWRAAYAPAIVGEASGLTDALATIQSVADTNTTILIGGESGTGKELVARALHRASPRASGPFVAINAAALPEQLVETELFGHARGAFTDATQARDGKIVTANGGTLFLDEIGDMPLSVQAKLLRVIQERQVCPVGSDRTIPVDIRIVAASHRDLGAMVEEGTFRADLYYRLSVVNIALPALRERRSDLVALAMHLIRKTNQDTGRTVTGLDASAVRALLEHGWPGNVRELSNALERSVVVRRTGRLSAKDLAATACRRTPPKGTPVFVAPTDSLNLRTALELLERSFIEAALERANGNRSEAAALLGLNRTTLVEKLRKI